MAQVANPPAQGEKRVTRKKQDDMPLADVIKWALLGVMLIGALGGGGWFWWTENQEAKQRAERQEENRRLRAERQAAEDEKKREEDRIREEERQRILAASGLTPLQMEARSLYMEMWANRGWERTRATEYLENWIPIFVEIRDSPEKREELLQIGLVPSELTEITNWLMEGKALLKLDEPQNPRSKERWEERWQAHERKGMEVLPLVQKWDAAFDLKEGKPKSDEQADLIAQQEKILREISGDASNAKQNLGNTGDVHGAWAYAQLFVKERLKSPKSADFPFGGHRSVVNLGAGRYRVRSYVDATNSFGGEIRTHFTCVVRSEGSRWVLESLTMD